MDSLPVPQLRSSWVAALTNTVILFLVYYLVAFDGLLGLYKNQFDPVYFEQSQNQLEVLAYVPRYYNSSEPAGVYLHIENKGDNPVYDIEVYLITTFDETTLLLYNLYNREVYGSGIKFDFIAPHSIATARISLVAQAEPIITKVLLITAKDGNREELERLDPKEFIRINESGWRALQHSFLETILLPPWSNGFILALALFSTYVVRKGDEEKEPEPFKDEWWDWVASTIKRSLIVLGIITGLITLFLITNETTYLCLIALVAMWILNLNIWKDYLSSAIKELLIYGSLILAILALVPTVLQLLLAFLEFLYPKLFFSPSPSIQGWLRLGLFIMAFLLTYRATKKTNNLEILIKPLEIWAYSFSILSVLSVIHLLLIRSKETEEYVSWVLLAIVGFGTRIWRLLLVHFWNEKRGNTAKTPVTTQKNKRKGVTSTVS